MLMGISGQEQEIKNQGIYMKTKYKILVSGATGMDGAVMSEYLLSLGHDVIGIKRRSSTDNTWRLKTIINHPNFKLVEGDITDFVSILDIISFNRPHFVLNFAAQSHVGTSFDQPSLTWDITATGAINVMNACKAVDKNIRIFQASTSEMFGDNYDIVDGEKVQTIGTRFSPNSPYAVAKLAAHNYAQIMRDAYGMFVCPIILFNHTHNLRGDNFVEKKITKWFVERAANKTKDKLKLGNIESYRDFGWSLDYMKAIWLAMNQDKSDDYVIATGKTYQIKYILEYLLGPNYMDYVEIDQSLFRPKEVPYLRGLPSKNLLDLGWRPELEFEKMLDKMIEPNIAFVKTPKQIYGFSIGDIRRIQEAKY